MLARVSACVAMPPEKCSFFQMVGAVVMPCADRNGNSSIQADTLSTVVLAKFPFEPGRQHRCPPLCRQGQPSIRVCVMKAPRGFARLARTSRASFHRPLQNEPVDHSSEDFHPGSS